VGDVPAHLRAPGYGAVLSAGRALTGFLHDVPVVVPGTPEPYWVCDPGGRAPAAEDAWALGGEGPVEGWGGALPG
jgi:hypothetical protein